MQNFGKIKEKYNQLLSEGLKSDNKNKNLFKKYIKTLKENDALKTQFLIYSNIENKVEPNEFRANQYLKENIDLLHKFDLKKLQELNLTLAESISLDESFSYTKSKLHENISKIIFTKKNATNIDEYMTAYNEVVDYIVNNKVKEITESVDLPVSVLTNIMADKFNEAYSELNESEKEVLTLIINSKSEDKKNIYHNMIDECISLVDKHLTLDNTRGELAGKLIKVKDKLITEKNSFNEDSFEDGISKLIELKNNLN
jgi:hypothetical protein